MQNIVKRMNVTLVAVALGFGLITLQSAFKPVSNLRADAYWRYNATNASLARDGSQYSLIAGNPDEQACDSEPDMPCIVKVPAEIDTQAELHTYLQSNFTSPAAVTASAYATKAAN